MSKARAVLASFKLGAQGAAVTSFSPALRFLAGNISVCEKRPLFRFSAVESSLACFGAHEGGL